MRVIHPFATAHIADKAQPTQHTLTLIHNCQKGRGGNKKGGEGEEEGHDQ